MVKTYLGHDLHGPDKVSQHYRVALVKKFLAEIGYSFANKLTSEINNLVVANLIL